MIEPSMQNLMQYLSSLRKPEPSMMPPVQQPNPMEMLAMQAQQQRQPNPMAQMLAAVERSPLAGLEGTAGGATMSDADFQQKAQALQTAPAGPDKWGAPGFQWGKSGDKKFYKILGADGQPTGEWIPWSE